MKSKDKKDMYMLIIVHEVDFCAPENNTFQNWRRYNKTYLSTTIIRK